MSSTVAIFQNVVVSEYCVLAGATLIFWEYLALLPQEIDLFWKGRLSVASVLFLSNRYLSLLTEILQTTNPTSDQVVLGLVKSESDVGNVGQGNAYQTISILPYIPWAVFSALRTSALCPPRLKWLLGIFVLFLSSVPIWINLLYPYNSAEITIISRTCLIVSDFIVLGVTWYGTYRTIQLVQVAAGEQTKHTYSGVLSRDGTVYFVILATLNLLHLLFTLLSIAFDSLQSASVFTAFTDPLTSILVSRFLLDLQKVGRYRADPQMSSLSVGQGSLHFNSRVFGSLGESLPPPGDTSLEDERLAAEDASEVGHEAETIGEEARA
ncbi:hypothetical protein L227DRAFT_625650 [Lentinus tigrinus ALCF2SS1-6]|uniref:DUF6533 domain-containing protein n=1 Tax=Lentinus tigrinus ALCF2SS1-6 TaxID=1328759 RepID=A0A5C2S865_9APHY|nr:hypothetical protein L227DRAFT_625650 [Lentinus tigrinus ALCF2SS1-6]